MKSQSLNQDRKDFFRDVYEVVRLIPEGRVSSYGAIARYLGSSSGARMVGWAMNNSFSQIEPVPAHRVVNRMGMLSGKMHFPSPDEMQNRLEAEGVRIKDDRIINFEKHFWDPNLELSLNED